MSGLVIPSYAPARTRQLVTRSLMAVPKLARFLDTPGLLTAVCLDGSRPGAQGAAIDYLEQAARTSHRTLARDLGLPGLSVLRRLTGDALNTDCLAALKRLTVDGSAMRIIRHAAKVSLVLIVSLDDPTIRSHATTGFLAEVGYTRRRWRPRLPKLTELAAFLSEYRPTTTINSIGHFKDLRRRYYELIGSHRFGCREQPHFPSPPWPGELGYAMPLKSWDELIRESIEMKNCVGEDPAYMHNIEQGRTYFYRVEQAWGMSRATVYVEKHQDLWRIKEARTKCNQPLRRQELRCLATWIANQQGIEDEQLCLPED